MLWRGGASKAGYWQTSLSGPVLIVFLVDHSLAALAESGGQVASSNVARDVNSWLVDLVLLCSRSVRFWPWADVSVIVYGNDKKGHVVVESGFIGSLSGREIVSIRDIAENPARMDVVTVSFLDEECGECLQFEQQRPVWVDHIAEGGRGGAPLCSAIVKACEVVDDWIPRNPESHPPIVINMSSGGVSDGGPWPFADALTRRGTRDGKVLFAHTVSAAVPGGAIVFPHDISQLVGEPAAALFPCASLVPKSMHSRFLKLGYDMHRNARFMSVNSDLMPLFRVLPFGTRW